MAIDKMYDRSAQSNGGATATGVQSELPTKAPDVPMFGMGLNQYAGQQASANQDYSGSRTSQAAAISSGASQQKPAFPPTWQTEALINPVTEATKTAAKTENQASTTDGTKDTRSPEQIKADQQSALGGKITGVVSALDPIAQQLELFRQANLAQYNNAYANYASTTKYAPDTSQTSNKYSFLTADLQRPPKESDFTKGMPSASETQKYAPLTGGLGGAVGGAATGAQIGSLFGGVGLGTAIGGAVGLVSGAINGLYQQYQAKELDEENKALARQQWLDSLENYRLKREAAINRVAETERQNKIDNYNKGQATINESQGQQYLENALTGKKMLTAAVEGSKASKVQKTADKGVKYKMGGMYGRY